MRAGALEATVSLHAYNIVTLLVFADSEWNDDNCERVSFVSILFDVFEHFVDALLVHRGGCLVEK